MLNGLIDLLKEIWDWLDPFVIVDDTESGVLYRFGHIQDDALEPGLHWRWWGIERIAVEVINERTIDLPTVYVTSGERTRAVSANLVVQTVDPVLMHRQVFEPEQSAARRAAGALAAWARTPGSDDRALKKQVGAALREWGIRLKRIELTIDVMLDMKGHMVEGSTGTIFD